MYNMYDLWSEVVTFVWTRFGRKDFYKYILTQTIQKNIKDYYVYDFGI